MAASYHWEGHPGDCKEGRRAATCHVGEGLQHGSALCVSVGSIACRGNAAKGDTNGAPSLGLGRKVCMAPESARQLLLTL